MSPEPHTDPAPKPAASGQAWFALFCGIMAGFCLLAALYLLAKGDHVDGAIAAGAAAALFASAPFNLLRRRKR